MPTNVLRKSTPRGRGPSASHSTFNMDKDKPEAGGSAAPLIEDDEGDLASREVEAMWEAEESGGTRWSGGDEDKRYSD